MAKNFKKIIFLLIFIFVIFVVIFIFLKIKPSEEKEKVETKPEFNLSDVVDKKNQGQTLSPEEAEFLNTEIKKETQTSIEKIENRAENEENIIYTQAELDYIANPEISAQKNIGLDVEIPIETPYTLEQLDVIANPDKYSDKEKEEIMGKRNH